MWEFGNSMPGLVAGGSGISSLSRGSKDQMFRGLGLRFLGFRALGF